MTDPIKPMAYKAEKTENTKALFKARLPLTRAGGPYSHFANSMRIVLPLVAAAIVVLVVAWPQLTEKPQRFALGVSKYSATDNGSQQIINALFRGTDAKNRPFTVTADTASQVKNSPDVIDLDFPKADITLQDNTWLALSAETGRYTRKLEVLNLRGTVSLFHDTGYELRTSAANVNMNDGTAFGNASVSGQGPFGTLKSSGFRILDNGKRIIFSGQSRLIFYPANMDPRK